MNALTRSKFDLAMTCIGRAKKELESHEKGIAEHQCWYSGHKGKTIRAIQMAQEVLQEIKINCGTVNTMIKQFIKRHFMLLMVTGIFLALTPQMFTYARTERGYDAIGGELFFPLLPLLAWLFWKIIQDMFKEFKNIEESEETEND